MRARILALKSRLAIKNVGLFIVGHWEESGPRVNAVWLSDEHVQNGSQMAEGALGALGQRAWLQKVMVVHLGW